MLNIVLRLLLLINQYYDHPNDDGGDTDYFDDDTVDTGSNFGD